MLDLILQGSILPVHQRIEQYVSSCSGLVSPRLTSVKLQVYGTSMAQAKTCVLYQTRSTMLIGSPPLVRTATVIKQQSHFHHCPILTSHYLQAPFCRLFRWHNFNFRPQHWFRRQAA